MVRAYANAYPQAHTSLSKHIHTHMRPVQEKIIILHEERRVIKKFFD